MCVEPQPTTIVDEMTAPLALAVKTAEAVEALVECLRQRCWETEHDETADDIVQARGGLEDQCRECGWTFPMIVRADGDVALQLRLACSDLSVSVSEFEAHIREIREAR